MSKRVHKGIRTFLALFWTAAFSWMLYSLQARGFPPTVLESDNGVRVDASERALSFSPVPDTSSVGLIFYPGALVDPEAYAPLARNVAERGYRAVVVKVPFRMASFDWQWEEVVAQTEAVLEDDPKAWVLGGHSRGGRMATRLVAERPTAFAGLLLVGTSHPRESDLSHLMLDVVKVYGSEDGLASEAEVEAFAPNLPESTRFVRVEGGNHRQFGYYGWQLGDGRATIDREVQRRATADAIVEQLRRIDRASG